MTKPKPKSKMIKALWNYLFIFIFNLLVLSTIMILFKNKSNIDIKFANAIILALGFIALISDNNRK